MLASFMAYTPIWSSIDPVRVVKQDNSAGTPGETNDNVEQYFS